MGKNRIQAIEKTKQIDYSNAVVENFWRVNSKQTTAKDSRSLHTLVDVLEGVSDSVICVQASALICAELRRRLFELSKRNNRIYLLVNNITEELKDLVGAILIRYGVNIPGSFVLINPKSNKQQGVFFTGDLSDDALTSNCHTSLRLSLAQIEVLFRFFSYSFWSDATQEIIADYNKPITVDEQPIDIYPNMDDFCDASYVEKSIKSQTSQLAISSTSYSLDNKKITDSEIYTDILVEPSLIQSLSNKRNKVYVDTLLELPKFLLSEDRSWLFPDSGDEFPIYALELDEDQQNEVKNLFNAAVSNCTYTYCKQARREDLVNSEISYLDSPKQVVKLIEVAEKELAVDSLKELTPKEEFEAVVPSFVDDSLSCFINYKWKISPFQRPTNTKLASLYGSWEQEQARYISYVSGIQQLIDESKEMKVSDKLRRLFLSKSQIGNNDKQALEDMKLKNLAILDKEELKELLKKLKEVSNRTELNRTELKYEVKKQKIIDEVSSLEEERESLVSELESYRVSETKKLEELKGEAEQEK